MGITKCSAHIRGKHNWEFIGISIEMIAGWKCINCGEPFCKDFSGKYVYDKKTGGWEKRTEENSKYMRSDSGNADMYADCGPRFSNIICTN